MSRSEGLVITASGVVALLAALVALLAWHGAPASAKSTAPGTTILDAASPRFTTKTSKGRTNPRLDATGLQFNRGPTKTIVLQTPSPAFNSIRSFQRSALS